MSLYFKSFLFKNYQLYKAIFKYLLLLVASFYFFSSVGNAQTKATRDSIEWATLKDSTYNYVKSDSCNLDIALILAQTTVRKATQAFGKKNKNYALSLNDLSFIYYFLQQYTEAKKVSDEALEVISNTVGKNDSDYATILNNNGAFREKLGDYTNTEKLYYESMSIRERLFTQKSLEYAQSLNNLGNYYEETGNLFLAEKDLKQALEIQMQINGKDYEYAKKLNNLGNVNMNMGRYAIAETQFKEALSIIDTASEGQRKDDQEYGNSLNNLASLYTDMNNYPAAINARRNVLDHLIKIFHRKTTDYATTSTRLAKLYIETGDYDSAFALLKDASIIYQAELDSNSTNNSLYAETLDQIASLYNKQNDFTNAEFYYKKAKDIKELSIGENNPSYAESLNNLGLLATKRKNYSEAKKYLDSASDIRLHQLGFGHPDYSESVNNILNIYYAQSDTQNWRKNISNAINIWQNSVVQLLSSFDEMQKENYLNNHLQQKDVFLSMLYYFKQHENIDSLSSVYYKMITAMQGWLLSGSEQLNAIIAEQHNDSLQNLYNHWMVIKTQYATAIQSNTEIQLKLNADSLLLQSEQIEMNLINKLPALQEVLENAGAFPSEVSKKLKNNEAFVSWVSFRYKAPLGFTDSILYGAFILLPKDSVAHFIVLFEQNALKKLLIHYHNSEGRGILKPNLSSVKNQNVDTALYYLIWKPLLQYIGKAKKVYTIPSGFLNKVSFYALVDSSKKTLLEKTELHLLTNISDLLKPSLNKKPFVPSISLFGGAYFNGKSSKTFQNTNNEVFPYLPGTTAEVHSLALKFESKDWHVQLHTGFAASEENFKKNSGKNAPYILHIATHGFYEPDNSPDTKSNFPLLRSGFALSGANIFWETDTTPAAGTDDGIVTAQEVSNLDFSKTNLVTLSACETALGDINNNEGVYGLQRAFKIAGVKDMLITLWEIPDEQTKELMNIFYDGMLKGDTYYDALRKAQLRMKTKYHYPAVWAGFELIGE